MDSRGETSREMGKLSLLGAVSCVRLAYAQGIYFMTAGLWPVFSIGSFTWVTGPKTDIWLVETVGLLIAVMGAAMIAAGYRKNISPETLILAIGSAASLAGIEMVYVTNGRISGIYLLDAFIEIFLIGLWLYAWRSQCIGNACSAKSESGAPSQT